MKRYLRPVVLINYCLQIYTNKVFFLFPSFRFLVGSTVSWNVFQILDGFRMDGGRIFSQHRSLSQLFRVKQTNSHSFQSQYITIQRLLQILFLQALFNIEYLVPFLKLYRKCSSSRFTSSRREDQRRVHSRGRNISCTGCLQ